MKMKLLAGLATGLLLVGTVGMASATSLTITNAGFEDDILLDGTWNSSAIPWTETDAGTWNPPSILLDPQAPEGNNVAWINSGSLYQDLDAVYQAADYTLSFDAGWRNYMSEPEFEVELLTTSGISLATWVSGVDISLFKGGWVSNSLTLMSTSIDSALIGDNIRIAFTKTGGRGQVNIDNVSLDAAPVPEPSTMLLLGSGLAGLAWLNRKRKKV